MAYDATDFVVTEVVAPETQERANMRLLRDFLRALPERLFDYSQSWPEELLGDSHAIAAHQCKTPVCILGWARVLSNAQSAEALDREAVFEWMGLSPEDGFELCFDPPHGNIKAAEAVRVLDHYLATGEINWAVAWPTASRKRAM